MEEVWFFFKVCEALYGAACIIYHIQGFMDELQPLPHQMYFCGTYFGFTIMTLFGCVTIGLGYRLSLVMETFTNAVASFCYLITSIYSMYHVERDFHLMYLTDSEEAVHPFLVISRKQSITALNAALLYMLHSIFAGDALLITEVRIDDLPSGVAKADVECYQPIKLYICGKTIHEFLLREKWFQWMTGQELRSVRADDQRKKQKIVRDILYVRSETNDP